MVPPYEHLDDELTSAETSPTAEPQKRNSGRTGPTSAAGRATSAQNARKHGACSRTLVLPMESEQGWLILLSRWEDTYKPREESLEADFVLRTAQAEWFRLRTQRQYDEFLIGTAGNPPFLWTPEQIKMHDLMLRYKNTAERSFQREYRLLEAHYKSHKLIPPAPDPELEPMEDFTVVLGTDEEIRRRILASRTPMDEPDPPLFPCSPPS